MLGAATAGTHAAPATPSRRRRDAEPAADEALQVDGLTVRDAEGVHAARQLHADRQPRRDRRRRRRRGQRPERARRPCSPAWLRPAKARFFVARPATMTGARRRSSPRPASASCPEDRHAVGCITGMSLAENLMLEPARALHAASACSIARALRRAARRADAALRRARRRPGRRLLRRCRAATSRRRCSRARSRCRGLVFLLAAQPTRGLDVGAVEAVYGQIRAACERGVGVLLISSRARRAARGRRPDRRALPRPHRWAIARPSPARESASAP